MLYHVSEEPGIARFDPRPAAGLDYPIVWAVHEDRLRNYLLPRDCPRVTFFAGPKTSLDDAAKFLGTAASVVAIESAWLERVQNVRLYCYRLPDQTFFQIDKNAGYFHSREPVIPADVEILDDLLGQIANRGANVRVLPSLWDLHDAVVRSTLSYSIIRMRNAQPRQ